MLQTGWTDRRAWWATTKRPSESGVEQKADLILTGGEKIIAECVRAYNVERNRKFKSVSRLEVALKGQIRIHITWPYIKAFLNVNVQY